MSKLKKSFSFEIPVTNLSTVNSTITSTLIGNIEIDGVVTLMHDRDHEIDYNHIKWNGTDILPLLDNFPGADDMMDSIMEASMNHIANTFDLDVELGKRYSLGEVMEEQENNPPSLLPMFKGILAPFNNLSIFKQHAQ